SVTNNNNQQVPVPANSSGGSVAARVHDFVRMNPPEFLGLQVGEYPQNIIDEVKKFFGVMQVTGNDRVELASYQLKDVAHVWFFPRELREENAQEFMNLRQASIVPLESMALKDSLTYEDVQVQILDRQGATWEAKAAMKAKYPHLFPSDSILA
ncbi:hypothetical protein MTR67_018979, partial [Solanum verrucosum]